MKREKRREQYQNQNKKCVQFSAQKKYVRVSCFFSGLHSRVEQLRVERVSRDAPLVKQARSPVVASFRLHFRVCAIQGAVVGRRPHACLK